MRAQFLIVLIVSLFLCLSVTVSATTTTTTETTTTSTTTETTTTEVTTTTTETTTTSTTTETTTTTSSTTTTTTINIDFGVGSFIWNPINPYPGQNLTVFSNITKVNESDQNIAVQWKIYPENNLVCEEIVNASSFNATKEFNCTFAGFSGQKNITLVIDLANSIQEVNESNNYYSKIISTDLNISIPSNLGSYDNNRTIPLNSSIMYWNNNQPVSDMNISNFEVYDKWLSGSDEFVNRTSKISENNFSLKTSDLYLINYISPEISDQTLQYGEHEIKFKVKNGNFSTETTAKYSINGPYLSFSFPGIPNTNTDLNGESSKTISFDIKINNTGNREITSVNLYSISVQPSNGEISDYGNCLNVNKQITPNNEVTLCEGIKLKVTQTDENRVTIWVNGTYNSSLIKFRGLSQRFDVLNTDPNEDTKEPEFNLGKTPQKTLATSVVKKYLTISSFPSKVELEQGERKTETVTVKNEDDFEFQDVTFKVTGIDSTWLTIIPSQKVEVEPLKSQQYRVAFVIPEDAEVKDYQGEFQASSSLETKKQTFTLSVVPGPTLQVSINSTIQDYQNQIQQLEKDINEKKRKGYNTTEAEQKLQQLKDEFSKLLTYRDGGNYKSAYELLDETNVLLNQTASLVSGAFILSSHQLFGSAESNLIFSGLVSLLVIAGGYTFWGRHFKVKEKLLGKIKRKKGKQDAREKELEAITSQITDHKLVQKELKEKPMGDISDRMRELETIKNLVKGTNSNSNKSSIAHKEL